MVSKCNAARVLGVALSISTALGTQVAVAEDQPPELAICTASSPPDASVAACTQLIEMEVRESARRQAILLIYRADAWKAKEDIDKALADLNAAIKLDANFAPPFERRAEILRDAGKYEQALSDYDQAIRIQPDNPAHYLARALCHVAKGDHQRALADVNVAIKLEGNNKNGLGVQAWALKARLYGLIDDLDDALSTLEEAIKIWPDRAPLFIDRAAILLRRGDTSRALADLARAMKLDANNKAGILIDALQVRAQVHLRNSNLDGALADYDAAIKLLPAEASLYAERAAVWARKGNDERALADYGKAIELDPSAAFYIARGDFQRANARYAAAIKDYDAALAQEEHNLRALSSRGLVRFYMANFAAAATDFQSVMDGEANVYSALLLYLSRSRSGAKTAWGELAKSAAQFNAKEWPYPVIDLFLGRKQLGSVEAAAQTPEQQCEARFYLGQWHLMRGAHTAAAKSFQAAVDTCPKDFVEYRAAFEELRRMK